MKQLRVALVVLVFVTPKLVAAIPHLDHEEDISDLLVEIDEEQITEEEETQETRRWAVLPELGYGPETGPLVGVKYTHRNFLDSGATFDIDGTYALNQQQGFGVSIAFPHAWNDRLIILAGADYDYDPQRRFFGLGNNEFGPEPISTNGIQDAGGGITVGWRVLDRLAVNLSVGLRQVDITNGQRLNKCQNVMFPGSPVRPCPFTPQLFPDLAGIDGGLIQPIGISLVYNDRDDLLHPTRGWRVILKIVNTNHIFSDFKFTRYIADISYLRWLFNRRLVAGLRLNGEYVDGGSRDVPFWELSELGGKDTLRGFFPYRFFGQGRILLSTELRASLFDFDFFDVWRVKVDGVLFGDAGRVFLDRKDLQQEFDVDSDIIGRILGDFRYDYGGGIRFALSQALVARIDVGFSEEETGLVYLSFGHTF